MEKLDELMKKIDDVRNVKPATLRAYRTNLKKTWENVDGDGKFNYDFLDDHDEVMDFMKEKPLATQRTYLASLLVATTALNDDDNSAFYRQELGYVRDELQERNESGEKSEKQDANWVGMDALRKVVKSMKKELIDDDVFQKKSISKRNMKELRNWVIASLFVGDETNPPTRLDYAPMKIISQEDYKKLKDDEKEEMNYLVIQANGRKFFSFNDYKTSNKYGTREVKVGKHLNKVLDAYLKHHEGEYLLYTDWGKPMTSHQLGIKIKQIFSRTGKNITSSLIRAMYISEKFPRNQIDEREEVAHKMGHSTQTQGKIYSKKN